MQLRLSTRTMDGVLIIDAGGRIVFGEESASLRDTVKKLIPDNKNIVLSILLTAPVYGATTAPYHSLSPISQLFLFYC